MARYGLDYYSSLDFPLSYYGPDSPLSFVAEDLQALSTSYGKITLSWTTPVGAWAKLKIVRNKYGFPVNITDGLTVFDTTRGLDPQFFDDTLPATEPKIFYYSLFVLETTQLQWVNAGRVSGLSVFNYNMQTKLYDYVPEVMKLTQPYTANSGTDNADLRNFLGLFGFQFDYIKSLAQISREKYNPEKTPGVLLSPLLTQFGINYEPEIGFERSRVLLRDALIVQKSKGSRDGLRNYVRGFTGWGVIENKDATVPNKPTEGVQVSHNILLDYNDASFEEGVGHWVSPNSSGTLSQVARKDINEVAVVSNTGRLFIGAHGFKVGMKIFIFNVPYPIFNKTVTSVAITAVDADSISYSLTSPDVSRRNAYNYATNEAPYILPQPEPWVEATTPALFPNKRKGLLAVKNALNETAEVTISCGDNNPVTDGVPVDSGQTYTFSFYSGSNLNSRSMQAAVKWYDRFGVLIQTSTGNSASNTVGSLGARPFVTDIAPTKLFLNAITSGGTGYGNGSFTNVPLTYVSGKQPTITPLANVFISGGVVLSASIPNGGAGADTTTVFTINNSLLGGTGSGLLLSVQKAQECYYAVPQIIISSVGASSLNEYHFFDAAQFEKSATVTSYDDARSIHLTFKANRINELANPRFESPTTPWSVTNATATVVSGSAEPNIDFYSVASKQLTSNVATLITDIVHTYKSSDVVVITNMGAPFDGVKTLLSAGDNELTYAATGTNVPATAVTSGEVYKSGNAFRVTSSGTTQVLIKSTTTSADLMGIYYPETAYSFSVYVKAGQTSNPVTPSIVWYNSSKTVISTASGSAFPVNATGWVRASVTAVAPDNAAYAHVQLAWTPLAASNILYTDAALFENSFFVLEYFDGSVGFSSTAELFWEGATPNAGRSHYYKNRVAIESRMNAGALDEYVGLGASYAVYLAQPKT
jgi:hypothetical protein